MFIAMEGCAMATNSEETEGSSRERWVAAFKSCSTKSKVLLLEHKE